MSLKHWCRAVATISWCLAFFLPLRAELAPRAPFEPDPAQLARLHRSIALLQSATPERHIPFRILFYGQSHTLTGWWRHLSDGLRATYPHVDFVITNKAMVGLQAGALAATAISDIGPWQPDLIFIHALGKEFPPFDLLYERLQVLTTADVIAHSDHPLTAEELVESSDDFPQTIWYIRNYDRLPALANAHGHAWADVRTPWKNYLVANGKTVHALLGDDKFHMNDDGDRLQAEILLEFLKPRRLQPPLDPWNTPRVVTKQVGEDIHSTSTGFDLNFTGNRVDVIYQSNPGENAPQYTFTIDNQPPSIRPELWGFDRVGFAYKIDWPGILSVGSSSLLQEETWTLQAESTDGSTALVQYNIRGSKTGPDGSGRSDQTFVSNSKRVVINAGQVSIGYAVGFTQVLPPANYEVQWNSVKRFTETFKPVPGSGSSGQVSETLFVGTSDTPHRLQILSVGGKPPTGIQAIRVHSPSGLAALSDRVPVQVEPVTRLTFRRDGNAVTLLWPTAWTSSGIEYSSDMATGSWTGLNAAPVATSAGFKAEIPAGTSAGFYRQKAR